MDEKTDSTCPKCSEMYETGREDERREIAFFLRNHARFAGFMEDMTGKMDAQELLEQKATQIENGYKKLCFGERYP